MTKSDDTLTLARVNQLLRYDPLSGEFRRRIATSSNAQAGQLAGTFNSKGYRVIGIDGRRYYAHRLAWLVAHGEWPSGQIDHLDGDRSNNQLTNLRPATHVENSQNRGLHRNNSSGHPGVYLHTQRGKWCSRIMVNYKTIALGLFTTMAEAVAARQAAEIFYFKEFRRVEKTA